MANQLRTNMSAGRGGTGYRHKVKRWPVSALTGRQCRLVVPPPAVIQDKKFVLIVGESHLRPFVDGFAEVPGGHMSFGFLSVPGATAKDLRVELQHVVLSRVPDAICIMAPSNNLVSGTISSVGKEFGDLLRLAIERCPKVFVQDFVPRLTVDPEYQELMRQEFRRVAVRTGVKYFPMSEHFPYDRLNLWCRDGVHLSDAPGSRILGQLLWRSARIFFESLAPVMVAASRSSPYRTWHVPPKVVFRGPYAELPVSDPFAWQVYGRKCKRAKRDVRCHHSASRHQQPGRGRGHWQYLNKTHY